MGAIDIKRFTAADETRKFAAHGQLDLVKVGGTTVGCARFEPGWRWSIDVAPLAGTRSCESKHLAYVVSGRMRTRMDDGEESEMKAGDMVSIEPGHDAWVVGDEPCVVLDFVGFEHYAQAQPTRRAIPQPEAGAAVH